MCVANLCNPFDGGGTTNNADYRHKVLLISLHVFCISFISTVCALAACTVSYRPVIRKRNMKSLAKNLEEPLILWTVLAYCNGYFDLQ